MNITKSAAVFALLIALAVSTASCSRLGLGSNEVSYSTIVVPPDMAEEMEQDLVAAIEPHMSPDVIIRGTTEVGVVEFDESIPVEPQGREVITTEVQGHEPTMQTFVTFRYPAGTRHDAEIRRALGMEPPGLISRVLFFFDQF